MVADSQEQVVTWRRSMSNGVTKYKFKIKKENERSLEYTVEDTEPEAEMITYTIPISLQDSVEYRINVYSIAEYEDMVVESEPCHVKVVVP